jgi:hypothetical protein
MCDTRSRGNAFRSPVGSRIRHLGSRQVSLIRRTVLPNEMLTGSIVVIRSLLRRKSATDANAARVDRPWRRPGTAGYATTRLAGILDPPVTVVQPASPMIIDRDVAVVSRDGTTLRVNCYRPVSDDPVPVLLCAHPYGKDRLPRELDGVHAIRSNTASCASRGLSASRP